MIDPSKNSQRAPPLTPSQMCICRQNCNRFPAEIMNEENTITENPIVENPITGNRITRLYVYYRKKSDYLNNPELKVGDIVYNFNIEWTSGQGRDEHCIPKVISFDDRGIDALIIRKLVSDWVETKEGEDYLSPFDKDDLFWYTNAYIGALGILTGKSKYWIEFRGIPGQDDD